MYGKCGLFGSVWESFVSVVESFDLEAHSLERASILLLEEPFTIEDLPWKSLSL